MLEKKSFPGGGNCPPPLPPRYVRPCSFRSIIKATEKFPGDGGIWSPGMDLWWGIWTAFRPREGEFEQKFSKNSNARGVARGGMLKLRFDWYVTCTEKFRNRLDIPLLLLTVLIMRCCLDILADTGQNCSLWIIATPRFIYTEVKSANNI